MREVRTKVQAIEKEATEKVSGLLTEDQKKTWKEMVGEPFEIKMERPQGGLRQGRPAARAAEDRVSPHHLSTLSQLDAAPEWYSGAAGFSGRAFFGTRHPPAGLALGPCALPPGR